MLLTVLNAKGYPLVTLGDAIASFFEDADPTTKNMCLVSKEDVEKLWSKPPRSRKWKGVIEQGYYAVSFRRWMNVNILYALTIGPTFISVSIPLMHLGSTLP
jgi:hypothetical protein